MWDKYFYYVRYGVYRIDGIFKVFNLILNVFFYVWGLSIWKWWDYVVLENFDIGLYFGLLNFLRYCEFLVWSFVGVDYYYIGEFEG